MFLVCNSPFTFSLLWTVSIMVLFFLPAQILSGKLVPWFPHYFHLWVARSESSDVCLSVFSVVYIKNASISAKSNNLLWNLKLNLWVPTNHPKLSILGCLPRITTLGVEAFPNLNNSPQSLSIQLWLMKLKT